MRFDRKPKLVRKLWKEDNAVLVLVEEERFERNEDKDGYGE